ncbi:MAG: lipid-A-disaccharide synthase [Campylobacteraceae bacterium]
MKKLLVSSLEPSANLHLKPVLDLANFDEILGIYDKSFGKPLYDSSEFSVMGFLDVLGKIIKAKKAIKEMVNLSFEVNHVLLIDSPAFNIPLARAIKEANKDVKITYYILPKVWAWKPKRVEKVEKYCDNLASIFPFEDKFYNKSVYVGNPLLDELKLTKTKLSKNGKIVFMPGSRKSEITKLMPVFKEVAKRLNKENIVVIPKHFDDEKIKALYGDLSEFKIMRDTNMALFEAEFAFVCSGTATLEAAIIKTPQVLCYRAKKLDFLIAKRFVKLKHSGLANIIFDFSGEEPLHKEFFQEDVSVQNLLKTYENMDREKYFKQATKLKEILKHGSSETVSKMIG